MIGRFDGIDIGRPKIPNPLDLVKRDLIEMKSDLIEKVKNSDNDSTKNEIAEDIGELDHFVEIIDIVRKGVDKISKKYGWDK